MLSALWIPIITHNQSEDSYSTQSAQSLHARQKHCAPLPQSDSPLDFASYYFGDCS